jgi:hypothetical protein
MKKIAFFKKKIGIVLENTCADFPLHFFLNLQQLCKIP